MERIEAHAFRNLHEIRLELHPQINVLIGGNGAGKTSVLEAVFTLSRLRSFRTQNLDRLIAWGATQARVIAVRDGERLAVARSSGTTRIRLNGSEARSRSVLAGRLPVQIINTEHQRLLLDGPAVRRSYLDWGAFHLDSRYRRISLRYREALRQRNAALRSSDRRSEAAWTPVLAVAAEELDRWRQRFVAKLEPIWTELIADWLGFEEVSLRYHSGGPSGCDWLQLYTQSKERDRAHGFTHAGPHRADLILARGGSAARDACSRGEQKLLVIALLLAEVRLWAAAGLNPVLLIDDLAAELDTRHREAVVATLRNDAVQLIMTAIGGDDLPTALRDGHHYELENGVVKT